MIERRQRARSHLALEAWAERADDVVAAISRKGTGRRHQPSP